MPDLRVEWPRAWRIIASRHPPIGIFERLTPDPSVIEALITLGRYDVVEIFEAPDDEVAIEILMKLNRYGAEHTETLRAFTREEAEGIVRKL